MNLQAIGAILFEDVPVLWALVLGALCAVIGALGVVSAFAAWARPLVRKERLSAMRHHVYEICVDLGNKVQDRIITPKEAELILRVALVAVCRGNKKLTSYVHHVEMEAMIDERD